jgi:predicted nucleotidyltransferase
MTGSLLDLSGKIDGKTIAALFEIDKIAGALNIPYFIVGATARDILLQYAHNIHTTRATLDIDIGVFVADWKQFQDLRQTLLRSKKFGSTKHGEGNDFAVLSAYGFSILSNCYLDI